MKKTSFLTKKFKDLLKEGKTLVYFASGGEVKAAYQELPYENVILVNRTFRGLHETGSLHKVGRVLMLVMDAAAAVQFFRRADLKIDAMVAINEGLFEGGGHYAINADTFLGYVLPLLADPFLHIGDRNYYPVNEYGHLHEHWLDIPYEKKKILSKNDPDYLDPAIFTDDARYARESEVTLLSGRSLRSHSFVRNGKKFNIRHESIWTGLEELDALFVPFENSSQRREILKALSGSERNKVFSLKIHNRDPLRNSFDHRALLEFARLNGMDHIGLVPNGEDYRALVERIAAGGEGYPREVTFYHLNKDDFHALYEMKGDQDMRGGDQ